MARELGPQGIHVAHVVIDGAIDTPLHRRELPRALRAEGARTASSAPTRSPTTTGTCTASTRARGRTSSTCAPGWKPGEHAMSDTKRTVEYFFDVGSPTAYLAWTQLPQVAAETGADDRLAADAARRRLQGDRQRQPGDGAGEGPLDERRHRALGAALRRAVPLQSALPDQHADADARRRRPADAPAGRLPALLSTSSSGRCGRTPKNLGDPAVLAATLAAAGFDADEFAALVGDPEVKARLVATTEEAVARGVFGAPTFFVGERCSSARTGSTSSARRCSRAALSRAGAQRSVRSFQISGNRTTSSILRR